MAASGGDKRLLARAHDTVVGAGADLEAFSVRQLVRESWQRSLGYRLNADRIVADLDLSDEQLRAYRNAHPLHAALPVLQKLLIRHAFDAELIVAVGDSAGRLLWIDGDRDLRRRAEGMGFLEGANWSEPAVGTSAPGTALAVGRGIQISGAEHFGRVVHPWSCTAVPVREPGSGAILGVVDITGGDAAAEATMLPLVEAAVAAVEAELRVQRLDEAVTHRAALPAPIVRPELRVLGRDNGELAHAGGRTELSARHVEILTLLAWHPTGLSAERLSELLYGREDAVVTLRAEMVRLRRELPAELAPLSRPYRLPRTIDIDARRVLDFLDRGAHKVALGSYPGPVLPGSDAPGIVAIREELRATLREAMVADAAPDVLLAYARSDDAAYDLGVWTECLRVLPAKSPKRAAVVSRIERLERELGRDTVRAVQPDATSAQPSRS
jgi:hypothetical protein